MSISITNTESTLEVNEKSRNLYDNYDNLISVIKYDQNKNIDYVLKSKNNFSGKSLETQKFEQVIVDITNDRGPTDITENSFRLRARVYKNNNSKIFETGFIYWVGNPNESVLGKSKFSDLFNTPTVFKGNFSKTITDLPDNTTFNYRAFVRHEYGTNYSAVYQVSTIDSNTIFSIVGNRFNGPRPLTVHLSAVNAGFGNYTYAWNMTGGNIGFKYPLNSIVVASPGTGYTPLATNYTLNSINITLTGNGYSVIDPLNVLLNGTHYTGLTANYSYNNSTSAYGISSVQLPAEGLSGFYTDSFVITFSSANSTTITNVASGTGSGGSYTLPRENKVIVDGTYQLSLSVITYLVPETGLYSVSAIKFLSGSIDFFNTRNRTVTLSSNGPVTTQAVLTPRSSVGLTNADYTTRTITHVYSAAGNFTPKVYAIIDDQIIKQAIRIIRVTGESDYSPEWQSVLTAPFANNIIAAYDFRNLAGSESINQYPDVLWDFEPQNTIIPSSYRDAFSLRVRTPFLPNPLLPTIGGYSKSLNVGGYLSTFIAGYVGGYSDGINAGYIISGYDSIAGYQIKGYDYSKLFGPGVVGENGRALRFDPLSGFIQIVGGYDWNIGGYPVLGGYSVFSGQNWTNHNQYGDTFTGNTPFSISMWVKMDEFKEPGTKLFSVVPWGYRNSRAEFSITQSTTALKFFKNTYLDETIGGYLTTEPIAGYFTGYPMLCTNDPAKMLSPNVWNHMVVTRNNNRVYTYYKNGSFMLSASDTNWNIGGYDNIGGQFGFGGPVLMGRNQGVGGYAEYISVGNTYFESTQTAPPSGLIDSVAIWNKELSLQEVEELYNGGQGSDNVGYYKPIVGPKLWVGGMGNFANFINTTLEYSGDRDYSKVSLYAQFDGTEGSTDIKDSTSNNIFLSATNVAITTANKRFGSGSLRLNGIGGYVFTLSGDNYGAFGTDDFTIEWWEYIAGYGNVGVERSITGLGGYYSPIMFYGNPGTGEYLDNIMLPQWGITRSQFGNWYGVGGYLGAGLRFYLGGYANVGGYDLRINNRRFIEFRDDLFSNGGGFQLSAWSHNAIQRRKVAGYSYLADYSYYKNGILKQTVGGYNINITNGISGYGPDTGVIGAAIIGGYPSFQNPEWYYTDGYLDEIRITKGVARYTSNFTTPTSSYPVNLGEIVGTRFTPTNYRGGSFAVTQEPITVTYPHTMAFIGKASILNTNNTVFQGVQTTYNQIVGIDPATPGVNERAIFNNGSIFQGGLYTSNVEGNPVINSYIPNSYEWFYIAYSHLGPNNNNNIRYFLQTPTVSAEGLITGRQTNNISGYAGFGIGGYALVPYSSNNYSSFNSNNSVDRAVNSIDGVARLGLYINQGFNTHSDMLSLFKTITAGPANDITIQ